MINTKKHWFDRVPEIYQEIILIEFDKQRDGRNIYNCPSLSHAFCWVNTEFKERFFEALYCELEGLNHFIF